MKNQHPKRLPKILGWILFISLIASILFSFVRFLVAPEIHTGEPYAKVKSDYLLMLIQCLLGLLVMLLPSFLDRKWKIVVPDTICILYYLFLYCAIFLGEVMMFYYLIPHWDTMLHAFSGAMLAALGFLLIDILNKDTHVKVSLSPFFLSLFAFCFALAAGAVWEIYEFGFDGLLKLNMQKFRDEAGAVMLGRAALEDTMKDLIIDALSALGISVLGYLVHTGRVKRQRKKED